MQIHLLESVDEAQELQPVARLQFLGTLFEIAPARCAGAFLEAQHDDVAAPLGVQDEASVPEPERPAEKGRR